MAGQGFESDHDAIADINVTPLVDVVLVLLVLFMVTAPMIAARGILVNSPKTVSGESLSVTLKLTLRPEGEVAVNDASFELTKRDEIRAQVSAYVAENPEAKAVIAADASVSHGDVMELIDIVKLAGVEKFALLTSPKESEE